MKDLIGGPWGIQGALGGLGEDALNIFHPRGMVPTKIFGWHQGPCKDFGYPMAQGRLGGLYGLGRWAENFQKISSKFMKFFSKFSKIYEIFFKIFQIF